VKVQPLGVWSDFFSLFGLPRKLSIDPDELQRRFYDRSRMFHPDFFQQAGAEEQSVSLENSALVNAAYRALRGPISRVEYLIRLEEGAAREIRAKAPADLLEKMLELQEAIEDARASGLDGEARRRLEEERRSLLARREAEESRLLEVGREWDALIDESGRIPRGLEAARSRLLERMKEILAAAAYLTTVIDRLNEALGEETAHVPHRRH
jgi:molecular chaperone HscB